MFATTSKINSKKTKEIRSSKNFFADTSANLYEMAETN